MPRNFPSALTCALCQDNGRLQTRKYPNCWSI